MTAKNEQAKPNTGLVKKTFQPKPSELAVALQHARQNWFQLSAMTVYSED